MEQETSQQTPSLEEAPKISLPSIAQFMTENGGKLYFPLKDSDDNDLGTWQHVPSRDVAAIIKLLLKENFLQPHESVDDLYVKFSKQKWSYFSWNWETKQHSLSGTLPKRLSKLFYEVKGMKMPPEMLTQIGNLAARSLLRADNLVVDFTRQLDWGNGDFGDDGSCYWGDHWMCRGTIEYAGGGAMRYYRHEVLEDEIAKRQVNIYSGLGRAWMVPDVPEKGSAAFFNVYGRLSTSAFASLAIKTFKHVFGIEYDVVTDINFSTNTDNMYINGDECCVVFPAHQREDIDAILYDENGVFVDWYNAEERALSDGIYCPNDDDDSW